MTGDKEKRVALIIGNAKYDPACPLKNPKNDAEAIGQAFKRLGFDVTLRTDLNRNDFLGALQEFASESDGADMAAIYFAGHGIEVNQQNFLIPIDAKLERATDVEYEAITLHQVLTSVDGAHEFKLVILDACRDNPFRSRLRAGGSRSIVIGKGLRQIHPGDDMLIAYAAKHGTTAQDGKGNNSPYVEALLSYIETPGLEVESLFRAVRDDVQRRTDNKQTPCHYASLGEKKIYFIPPDPSLPKPPRRKLWHKVAAGTGLGASIAALAIFLLLYNPDGTIDLEMARIGDLKVRAGQRGPEAERAGEELDRLGFIPVTVKSANRMHPVWIKPGGGKEDGNSFQDCWGAEADRNRCGPRMVVVPADGFNMGSPQNEVNRSDDEDNKAGMGGDWVHVRFKAPFAVGKFEISFAQWSVCHADGDCKTSAIRSNGEEDNQPVVNISWTDITDQYLPWLNTRVSGKPDSPYRLLTETEWEYAARARTASPYWFGDKFNERQVRVGGGHTMPVDTLAANKWGLHHVHGNVWEWVQDRYLDSYKDVVSDGASSQEVCQGARVARGGSFTNGPADVRSAKRLPVAAHLRSGDIGFRLARSLELRNAGARPANCPRDSA